MLIWLRWLYPLGRLSLSEYPCTIVIKENEKKVLFFFDQSCCIASSPDWVDLISINCSISIVGAAFMRTKVLGDLLKNLWTEFLILQICFHPVLLVFYTIYFAEHILCCDYTHSQQVSQNSFDIFTISVSWFKIHFSLLLQITTNDWNNRQRYKAVLSTWIFFFLNTWREFYASSLHCQFFIYSLIMINFLRIDYHSQ